ncbi:alpha/beta fold hydrolase [Mycetocola tolaasinivorans]|uniref:Alpha/beta fold hydrolase n=1 Tax=Mycetocola tolaasinivorans TaxID=76635 RepID=A0A3L7A3Z8_9MICO|nr:alpha/beta fold hydrolase [Mycetocola tolaasinivorans]RLP75019.1 alpha/beta fold hydrolase [Mycetocola tolaasinivorans]
MAQIEVRAGAMLPARREDITLHTGDGLTLVGELALPLEHPPVATLVTLHPLPTAQGFMDSHILRKAAARLPALADLAVLRFNTRGTSSPRGTSDGHFEEGEGERFDVAAAMAFVAERGLPNPWLVGWSFGTELALKYGREHAIRGAILLSPPLHRASAEEVAAWHGDPRGLTALIPEHDDYLQPEEAAARFASVPEMTLLPIEGAKHLWVGEKYVKIVLDEIVRVTNPDALPLPTEWDEAEA